MAGALEAALLRGGLPGQTLAETVGGINVGLENRRREGLAARAVADLLGAEEDPQMQALSNAIRQNPMAARSILQSSGAAAQLLNAFEDRRATRAQTSATGLEALSNAALISARSQAPTRDAFLQIAARIPGADPDTVQTMANSYPDQFSPVRRLEGTDTLVQEGPGGQLRTVVSGAEALNPVPELPEATATIQTEVLQAIPATAEFLRGADQLTELIEERGEAVLGDAASLRALRDRVNNAFGGLIRSRPGDSIDLRAIANSPEMQRLTTGLPDADAQIARSMFTNLATALVRAQQGGRLTDQDIILGLRQIGVEGGNPVTAIRNLQRIGNNMVAGLEDRRRGAGFADATISERYPTVIQQRGAALGLPGFEQFGPAQPAPPAEPGIPPGAEAVGRTPSGETAYRLPDGRVMVP